MAAALRHYLNPISIPTAHRFRRHGIQTAPPIFFDDLPGHVIIVINIRNQTLPRIINVSPNIGAPVNMHPISRSSFNVVEINQEPWLIKDLHGILTCRFADWLIRLLLDFLQDGSHPILGWRHISNAFPSGGSLCDHSFGVMTECLLEFLEVDRQRGLVFRTAEGYP